MVSTDPDLNLHLQHFVMTWNSDSKPDFTTQQQHKVCGYHRLNHYDVSPLWLRAFYPLSEQL